jgi:hypothetical protein
LGLGENPPWFRSLKRRRPELVAEVLVQYASPILRSTKQSTSGIYGLAYDDDDAAIAAIAVPHLLRGFPLRASKEQHRDLQYLLQAGLKYMATNDFVEIVEQKLSLKSLDTNQRTLWLVTGLFLRPISFQTRLASHVGKSQARAAQVAGFFPRSGDRPRFHKPLPIATVAWLIGLLGVQSAPQLRDGWVSPVMAMGDLVRNLISSLSNTPGDEASIALDQLLSRKGMDVWHAALRQAVHGQATAQREAEYKHPAVENILNTLFNREPASASDLAALTVDHLNALARRVKDGSNNEYKSFWNNPNDIAIAKRRPEEECRDLVLKDLSLLLKPHGAIASKEVVVVQGKRADIGALYADYFVPIEIKADDEKNLWSALRAQLVDQYTRDPRTNGYGIYLVLWFGGKGMPPPPTGGKPKSATELAGRLRALCDPSDRHRISVCVIDCSLPNVVKSQDERNR